MSQNKTSLKAKPRVEGREDEEEEEEEKEEEEEEEPGKGARFPVWVVGDCRKREKERGIQ